MRQIRQIYGLKVPATRQARLNRRHRQPESLRAHDGLPCWATPIVVSNQYSVVSQDEAAAQLNADN